MVPHEMITNEICSSEKISIWGSSSFCLKKKKRIFRRSLNINRWFIEWVWFFWGVVGGGTELIYTVMRRDSQQMAMVYSYSNRREPHQQGRETSNTP